MQVNMAPYISFEICISNHSILSLVLVLISTTYHVGYKVKNTFLLSVLHNLRIT